MIMKLVIFLIMICSLNLYSQDIDYLKSQDTLYLLLKESEPNLVIKQDDISYRVYGNLYENQYHFTDKSKKTIYFITFQNDQIPGKSNLVVNRRKFFKKNKDNIIDFNFIAKHGLYISFIDILKGNMSKTIYVINLDKIRNKKITLKKTLIANGSYFSD